MRTKKPLVDQIVKYHKPGKPVTLAEGQLPNHVPKTLSTGSTLLNLAVSDRAGGGYGLGKIVNAIGDSSSGKSMLAMTALAEASIRKRFDNYRLIYDDVEAAMEFNLRRLFGPRLCDRIRPPKGTWDEPIVSESIEDFQATIHRLLDKGKPFIYVLDSLDALDSDDDADRLRDNLKARAKGKEAKGSYGMAKPKLMSQMLRQIVRKIKHTDSLLIVISQTRDNINPMSFSPKTRSGGKALEFYSSHIFWTAVKGSFKKSREKIGILCRIRSTKSKLNGKVREVTVPIYSDYGVDDIGSCVYYLLEQKVWKGKREKLIRTVEEGGRDGLVKLHKAVAKTWCKHEDSLKLNRRSRYD